jgi:hypothetical protein
VKNSNPKRSNYLGAEHPVQYSHIVWFRKSSQVKVWAQLHQHLNAKMYNIERKLIAVFSKRVVSLLMSFILQKKRSTMLRLA